MNLPYLDLNLPKHDAWGRQKAVLDKSLFSSLFTFDIPPRKWLIYENGAEVANSSSTKALSVNGAGYFKSDGGSVLVSSRRHARYQPNRGYYYAGAGVIDHKTSDAIIRWGMFTDENGHFFEYVGGELYCVRRVLGVDERQKFDNLNPNADLTNTFLFDIQVQMRNVGDSVFYITTGIGTAVCHMAALGARPTFTTPNPQLPAAFEVKNITEDNGIRVGCIDISTEGGGEPVEEYGSASFIDVTTAGGGSLVAAIRQPLLINGVSNTRDARLTRITLSCEKKATYSVYVTRNPASITTNNGDADWSKVNSGSYIEKVDTAEVSAFSTATSELLSVGSVQAGETNRIDNPSRETIDFFLVAGDIIYIIGFAAASESTVILEWGEEV